MNNTQINAAVVAGLFEDLSHKFMDFHDEICELKLTDKNHFIDVLLVKYIGAGIAADDLPLVRAILNSLFEYEGSQWIEEHKQLDLNFPESQ
ncbi:hypothetical protein [Pseudoalteromonas distincta]|uniref:hypothetical protein n=1 Tax=Pseudoalteromonas distincta TaxID=77608 RepID=UPI00166000B5|nr:hypothetical protein [Pseudoalteromonas distincta]MBD0411052.1 hypothetical protein [Pseudoalteromonas distincta]